MQLFTEGPDAWPCWLGVHSCCSGLLACLAPLSSPPFASLRRYPNRYESIIGTLCDSLESLDEPEAKASMIWIIGEYAERIDNAGGWGEGDGERGSGGAA